MDINLWVKWGFRGPVWGEDNGRTGVSAGMWWAGGPGPLPNR